MKAILIDVENQVVKNVDFDGSLEQMYKLIKCTTVEFCLPLGQGNVLFVDEEGLLKNPTKFFKFKSSKAMQWIAGNGLIFCEKNDQVIDTNIQRVVIEEKVKFMQCDDPNSSAIPQPKIFVAAWE